MTRTSRKPRRSTLVAFGALAIAGLTAAPAFAYQVCWDQYDGECLSTSWCDHYDENDNWIGSVRIQYQC